ncbi:MAG TPA: Fe-S cluster assembly protein SufD [Chlamydiales bacterium]|nr:Fe-S cluster assembly protein SufD [Chlamydiales bacterium]
MLDTSCQIVFTDGFLSLQESHIPDSIVCLPMDEAMRTYGVFLQNYMARTQNPLADQGVFIYIPPKVEVRLSIVHELTQNELASPRILFSLGKNAQLELQQNWDLQGHSVNAHIDAVLDAGSRMVLKNVQKETDGKLIHNLRASLKRDAHLTFRLYNEGSLHSRYSVKVQLLEENSEALLQGLICLDNAAHSHVYTTVEHLAPHTQSRQHFKALLKGKSQTNFEGKIFVHSDAQKTQGYQLCNNLLLSDQATVNVKPNLEIFADDVKASHGATLGQLDEEALFYLTSRGISLDDAKQYLIRGFVQELADCLP